VLIGPEILVDLEGPLIGVVEDVGELGAVGVNFANYGTWLAARWPLLQDRHTGIVKRCDAAIGSKPVSSKE